MFTEGIWNCMRELFYPDGQFLALQGGVNALSRAATLFVVGVMVTVAQG